MSWPDVRSPGRALLAAGTASYDSPDFTALDKVPDSLRTVVATLTGLGFSTVGGVPGYQVNPVLADLRAAVRQAATAAPVVVMYYTGHGAHPELDTYYLVSQSSQPQDFSGTALAATELPKLLTRRDAAGEVDDYQPLVLVILDCCFSGRAGMELLGQALHGIGNPRLWVIASAGALEYARQGKFAAAFCDALDRPATGPSTQFLSLESIVQAINEARAGRSGQEARIFLPAEGSAGIPPFFPNKYHRPGLAGLTVSEQHWLSRVRGAPGESTTGFYVTGRTGRIRAAEDLIGWMTSPDPGGLAVVTGSPGTGKSTLLALPVMLAQPARRAELLSGAGPGALIERAAALLPADTAVAAVHARGLNADQAAQVIAHALGLVPRSVATLLKDLKTGSGPRAVVVVDALDEAADPPDMLASLLHPLSDRPVNLRVAVGGRRHVIPAAAQLTIDLDDPRYQDPEALAAYLRRLLTAAEEPGIRTPYQGVQDEVTAAVAAAIARRATSRDGNTESFLIGRILALSVRGRPEPVDVTSPDWQARLPAELTEAFDEDLSRLGDRMPLARTLLEALAWAQGPGLPWENIWVPVARALAGSGRPVITNDDVRWLLDKAGAYVVEDLGPGQRSVYRPFHDVLAAYLRGEPVGVTLRSLEYQATEMIWRRHQLETEKVITNALLGTVPIDAAGRRQWDRAHPYLQTYLVQHAADTGTETASVLTQDTGFLAVTNQVTFSPYRGLNAFEVTDAPLFFGREQETAQLLALMSRRLDNPELLVVLGPSGSGKSSLLRAGLLTAIAAGSLPVPRSETWPRALIRPGRHPLMQLAIQIASLAGIPAGALEGDLRTDPASIILAIRQALLANTGRLAKAHGLTARTDPVAADMDSDQQAADVDIESLTATRQAATGPRLVLIVDQFEEVFTLCHDEQERQAFITALHAAATTETEPAQQPPALVTLGIRADFYARCAAYPQLLSTLQDSYLIPPMTTTQLEQVIVRPAQAAGSEIEAGLVEVLLADAAGLSGAVSLPLLSYALDQTWRSRSGQALTVADYRRTGGIERAVAIGAESIYDHLTNSQQAMTPRLFLRLIATSEDGPETGQRVNRMEISGSVPADQAEDLLAVIEAFAGAGLLTLTDDTIALSHEVLLTAWPRLRQWLADSHAGQIFRTRLRTAAADWDHSRRDPAYLYTGSLLAVAQSYAATIDTNQLPLSPNERAFLDASTRSMRRRMQRRRMLTVVLLVLLIVVAAETFALLSR